MLDKFSCFCCHLLTFYSKFIFFQKKSLMNTIRKSKGVDQDQDRHHVGPDLRPNCLQRLSADAKIAVSKKELIVHV